MKLTNDNEKKDYFGILIDILINIVTITIFISLFFIMYIIIKEYKLFNISSESEKIETSCVIEDIYKNKPIGSNDRYYILVDTESYGSYTIEISKGEFIKYKINDHINIIIKNCKAYIDEDKSLGNNT